jgi:hypothetical protein
MQFPANRIQYLNLVKRIAHEDVKKCLAGIHVTPPDLIRKVSSKQSQQNSPAQPVTVTTQNTEASPEISHVATPKSAKPKPVHHTEQKPEKPPRTHAATQTTPKQNGDKSPRIESHSRKIENSPRHSNRGSPNVSPQTRIPPKNQNISARLLKPTTSIAQKHVKEEKVEQEDFNNPSDFKGERKKQGRATSLLLHHENKASRRRGENETKFSPDDNIIYEHVQDDHSGIEPDHIEENVSTPSRDNDVDDFAKELQHQTQQQQIIEDQNHHKYEHLLELHKQQQFALQQTIDEQQRQHRRLVKKIKRLEREKSQTDVEPALLEPHKSSRMLPQFGHESDKLQTPGSSTKKVSVLEAMQTGSETLLDHLITVSMNLSKLTSVGNSRRRD